MKPCSLCGREIPDSATVCADCERWTTDSLTLPAVSEEDPKESFDVEIADPEPAGLSAPAAFASTLSDTASTLSAETGAASAESSAVFAEKSAVFAETGTGSAETSAASSTPPKTSTPPSATSPAAGAVANRRPLILALAGGGLAAILLLAVVTLRSTPSSNVAAAPARTAAAPVVAKPKSVVAPKRPVVATPKWTTENRGLWVGKRKNATAFEVPAENMVAIWMKQVRPILVVRCLSTSMDVFVFTNAAMQMEANTEDHTVTFSFDDEPPVTERWPDGAEHDALFAPEGFAFAERLVRARTLRFGYTPHNARPVTAHFQVSGLAELLAPVARECGTKK